MTCSICIKWKDALAGRAIARAASVMVTKEMETERAMGGVLVRWGGYEGGGGQRFEHATGGVDFQSGRPRRGPAVNSRAVKTVRVYTPRPETFPLAGPNAGSRDTNSRQPRTPGGRFGDRCAASLGVRGSTAA